jgi:hypothetical protein
MTKFGTTDVQILSWKTLERERLTFRTITEKCCSQVASFGTINVGKYFKSVCVSYTKLFLLSQRRHKIVRHGRSQQTFLSLCNLLLTS